MEINTSMHGLTPLNAASRSDVAGGAVAAEKKTLLGADSVRLVEPGLSGGEKVDKAVESDLRRDDPLGKFVCNLLNVKPPPFQAPPQA